MNDRKKELSLRAGENLSLLMKLNCISNKEMAAILGISISELKRIKNGSVLLKIEHAVCLWDSLGIPVDRIYNTENEAENELFYSLRASNMDFLMILRYLLFMIENESPEQRKKMTELVKLYISF